ncbi:MAG TPA: hypothetical protein VFU88_06570 [Ktedonobacterales bacterium]|nr:hypothetical protein [Ktedonobacterales bacterium]
MAFNPDPDQPNAAKAREPRWYIIISTVAALATIISVLFLVGPSLPFGKTAPKPTATPKPSPTPVVLTYSAQKPGPGCDANPEAGWKALNALVTCGESGLVVTAKIDPTVAVRLNAEVTFVWKNHPFPQDYSAKVNVTPHATSNGETICGGLDVLGSTAGSYILLVCSDGEWLVARYDEKGTASIIATGLLAKQAAFNVEVHVAGQDIISTVDGVVVNQTTRASAYAQTSFLELVTAQPTKIPTTDRTATAVFSDFSYSYQSPA